MTEILDEGAVSEIEARENAATPGPWAVWDSCSWRRIGTVEPFGDGNIICPITQNDGHPDLLARREDLEFAAHAREDIPALCATVKHLRAERQEILKTLEDAVIRVGASANCYDVPADANSGAEYVAMRVQRLIAPKGAGASGSD